MACGHRGVAGDADTAIRTEPFFLDCSSTGLVVVGWADEYQEVGADSTRVSRRAVLGGAVGLGGALAVGVPTVAGCAAGGSSWARAAGNGAPPVVGLHLQFGADASQELVVSWHADAPVSAARDLLGQGADRAGDPSRWPTAP
jgi:hypothetical protein